MQRAIKNFLSLAMVLGVSGCVHTHTPREDTSAQVQSEKPRCGNGMLTSLNTGNDSDFIRDFSKELKDSVKPNVFRKMEADLAARKEIIAKWHLWDTLDRGGVYRTEVWKVVLSRTGNNGKTNVELLFFVTTAQLDGKESVIGFKFDPFF